MSAPKLLQIDTLAELRSAGDDWDDLWRRSSVAAPHARAELVAQWIEHFSPGASLRALAVRQDGQLVAALPLVGGWIKRLVPVARLPSNGWATCGDLLLDPTADVDLVLGLLVRALRTIPWPVVWLEAICREAPQWRHWFRAVEAAGLPFAAHDRFCVPKVDIDRPWDAYFNSLPRRHRQQMGRMLRRAESDGGVELQICREASPQRVAELLHAGFEIEDRGWKAAAGTAVLRAPGMFEFYCRQARQLADWGQLQLTYLKHRERLIAFEYGWNSKGVYFSPKVGYDEAFAHLTPGQLLRCQLLQRFFADPLQRAFDFAGPATPAISRWMTGEYPVARLLIGNGSRAGRILLRAYHSWRPSSPQDATAAVRAGGRRADGGLSLSECAVPPLVGDVQGVAIE